MTFKVKNLMIHVLPNAEEKSIPQLVQAQDCFWISTTLKCVINNTLFIPPYPPELPLSSDPEVLAILKKQLQNALANVQAQEKAINEQTGPQTVEEAQALEDHLTAALEEVRRQKEELQNKAAGEQS